MPNVTNPSSVTANGYDLPTTEEFTHLESTFRCNGRADSDINKHLGKARSAFKMLGNVWKSSQCSTMTKLRLCHSCVVSPLLYSSECRRMTTNCDLINLSTFHIENFRRTLHMFWPETISNHELARDASKTALGPSSCRFDGDGLDM